MYNIFITITMAFLILKISSETLNMSTSHSFSLNISNKNISHQKVIKNITDSRIETLANIFRKNMNILKLTDKLDILFLIDVSSSVGENNFKSELRFVKRVLSDITVDFNHTRIAIVTFSSPSNIIKSVDEISQTSKEQTKCLLLNRQLKNINYSGGETFTAGAFQTAKEIFDNAKRNNSKKVLFLITDGYSSGGDPIPVADKLKNNHVMVFTIGIESGNYNELNELSSFAGESFNYLLNSFKELESLARRALHVDLRNGEYSPIGENQPCDILCPEGDCCDSNALCTCGTTTGHYACICRTGYYGSGLKNSCMPCASGTYSDGPNQCIPCPDTHHITVWPAYGLETCKCKDGYQTTRNNECKGTHCEKIVNACMSDPCDNGGTCNYLKNTYSCICKEGFTGKFCEDEVVTCNFTCLNNGTCIESETNEFICLCPTKYTGERCEMKINYCNGHLCQNNSTCIEGEDTFRCHCLNGFIGRRCNILPCDYKPCGEFSICINSMKENATKNDFSCVCPEGFVGKKCNIRLNHCQNNPCINGGSCSSSTLNYSCSCTNLYYGSNCQYKRNSNYLLYFQRYDTTDYIKLTGFHGNITEITACLWIQTSDNLNYGTLISYGTKYNDNTFTLTDYSGLVLYINNNYIVTDVVLNDGHWHHVCTIWQSIAGEYKIYLDGNMVKNGIGLSKNTYIQGNGNMIIGQEQDSLGGKFSLSESFIGKICYIDIWSKILQHEEILIHFVECTDSIFGNLYAWPEMQDFAYGGVQILESSFCKNCEEPKAIFNGKVEIINNIAYYSCFAGYELNMKKYINGRRCTKAAKWEGFYEPYCKKISCGYPGFVKNGYQIGNGYYFQDKIRYNCYSGFRMFGSNMIICGKDGLWFPHKPQCLGFQCVAFKKPINSELSILADQRYQDFVENITIFETGTQIEVICPSDMETYGENVITCTENGTWDYEPPECVKKIQHGITKSNSINCPIKQLPAAPNNGLIDLKSLYAAGNGTIHFVEYKCRPGYKLYGDNVSSCIIDGYWTQPNTTCRAVTCKTPPLLKNIILKEDLIKTYSVGDMISFQCKEGYSMFRNSVISCLANGKWSRMNGKCIKKSCRKPNLPRGVVVQGKSFLYNDTVTVMCSNGSSYKITCNKYGIWETGTEVC